MSAESARCGLIRAPWAFQYCRTMEIAADPQPSSLCLTNGTSSHTPAFSWGAGWPNRPGKRSRSKPRAALFMVVSYSFEVQGSAKGHNQDDDADGDHDNPEQISIGYASGSEIALRLAGPLGQLGKVFIAQLPDGFIHLLVVEVDGFQRLLTGVGRKQRSNGFLVRLTRLGRPCSVFVQVAQRNDMLLVLGPRRDSRRNKQSGNRQHRHTQLHAKTHSSSFCSAGGKTSLRIAGLRDKKLLQNPAARYALAAHASLRGQRFLVFGEVHGLPFTLDDRCANLRGDLSLAQLLVSVEIFADADVASRAVFAGEAIEQAAVPLAAVAVAVTRLLVESFFDSRCNRVSILHNEAGEELRIHGRRESAGRNLIVISRHRFSGPGLRRALTCRRTGSCLFRQDCKRQGQAAKSCTAQQSSASKHGCLPVVHESQTLRFLVYFTVTECEFPPDSNFVAFEGNDQGSRTTAIRTAASFVTSMTLSPFRLSIWLFAMK